jgi:hypothetical protein
MKKLQDFRDEISTFLEKVRDFAQNDLGCGCPEHVFEQVRILRGEASPGKTDLSIVIGERLLIMVVDLKEIAPFEYEMPRIVLSGVTYRDSIGLNRFRLVISGDVTEEQEERIQREIDKYDENVHVHYFD